MDLSTDIANWGWMDYFIPMLVVGIGVALLGTGAFTSYFGAGKSQQIGFILLFIGLVTTIVSYILAFNTVDAVDTIFDSDMFVEAFVSGVSALTGMIIGMFVILFVLMKVDTVDDLEDLDLEDLEDLDLDEELKKLEEELNQADNGSEEEEE